MPIRIVRGEIDSKDVTTRVIIPTAAAPRWAPFERVAETIAAPRRRLPAHRHEGVEVLTYVMEGSALYESGAGASEPLAPGSARLLTARASVSHSINASKGQAVRWIAVVVVLPRGTEPPVRLQSGRVEASALQPDGTIHQPIVGPGSLLTSQAGLECEAIEFRQAGTLFRSVGHDRVAVLYSVAGSGRIDNSPLDVGEAALIDGAAGVALQGEPGFRTFLSIAPRSADT